MKDGASLKILSQRIMETIERAQAFPRTQPWAAALSASLHSLGSTTRSLGQLAAQGGAARSLSNATAYLHFMGHTVVAWMWLKTAVTACAQLGDTDDPFLLGKLQAAQYFFRWELPKTEHWARRLTESDATVIETHPEWL